MTAPKSEVSAGDHASMAYHAEQSPPLASTAACCHRAHSQRPTRALPDGVETGKAADPKLGTRSDLEKCYSLHTGTIRWSCNSCMYGQNYDRDHIFSHARRQKSSRAIRWEKEDQRQEFAVPFVFQYTGRHFVQSFGPTRTLLYSRLLQPRKLWFDAQGVTEGRHGLGHRDLDLESRRNIVR